MRTKVLMILALMSCLALVSSSAFARPPECYEYCPCVGNDGAVCWDYGLSTCNEFCGTGFSSAAPEAVLFGWEALTSLAPEDGVQESESSIASPEADLVPEKS